MPQDPGNANARRVFKWSLVYLPVMLGAMLLHKKKQQADETGPDQDIQQAEPGVRGGQHLCLHEMLSPSK